MTTEPNIFTRREALLTVIKGTVAATLAAPIIMNAEESPLPTEPEFVPENDYPFFGCEL
jgi:hypothetical protein